MQGFELTKEQVAALWAAHKTTRDKRYAYRINAVILLGTGWTLEKTAEALLLDQGTLSNYVNTYREKGVDALLQMDYHGSSTKLTGKQIKLLDEHLMANTYLCVEDIVRYVQRRFGVSYKLSGMTAVLHRMSYIYKKPKATPGKLPDRKAQEAFIRRYDRIKRNKGENDPMYFIDGVHPQHNSVAAYGWIKRGVIKSIPSNTGRQHLNINGAVDIERLDVVTEFSDRIRLVREYLRGSRIVLVFLPAYSPNLNLIERLWKYFRKHILYNRYYEKFCQFKDACLLFFDNLKDHRERLKKLLTENFEVIGI